MSQEYTMDTQDHTQEMYFTRAVLGSPYLDKCVEGNNTVHESSMVASGREDGVILLWRKDRNEIYKTLCGT